jgi:hypothetical protein
MISHSALNHSVFELYKYIVGQGKFYLRLQNVNHKIDLHGSIILQPRNLQVICDCIYQMGL